MKSAMEKVVEKRLKLVFFSCGISDACVERETAKAAWLYARSTMDDWTEKQSLKRVVSVWHQSWTNWERSRHNCLAVCKIRNGFFCTLPSLCACVGLQFSWLSCGICHTGIDPDSVNLGRFPSAVFAILRVFALPCSRATLLEMRCFSRENKLATLCVSVVFPKLVLREVCILVVNSGQ